MKNKLKTDYRITLLILSVIIIVLVAIKFTIKNKSESFNQKKENLEVLIKASNKLKTVWEKGDLESLWTKGTLRCPELLGEPTHTSDIYLRCNPDYIQCFFQNIDHQAQMHFLVEHNGKKYSVNLKKYENGKYYQLITRSQYRGRDIPIYGVMVELYIKNKLNQKLKIILPETCLEAPIPRRIFGLGEMPKEHRLDWRWDSFNRNIYLDKHLVSNRDIREWIQNDDSIKDKINFDDHKLSSPATKLTYEQMKNYCHFRGKELANALVFDAATFLPWDVSEKNSKVVIRSPWHFTKNSKEGSLYQATLNPNFEVTKMSCYQAYTRECNALLPYENFNTWSPSYVGINNVLGGYMEVLTNIVFPEENLKASSFYFDTKENIHRLGKRVFWDTQGTNKRNFKFDENLDMNKISVDDFEVAFRCMRQYQ